MTPECFSGRALRAEARLHLADQKARDRRLARRRAPSRQRRQVGSRRWKRLRERQRQAEIQHRRRVRLGHHEAAKAAVAFAVDHRVGTLRVGDLDGITRLRSGARHNRRVQDWRPGHLLRTLRDKAQRAGITVQLVSERGSSSTCPECQWRVQNHADGISTARTVDSQGTEIWSVLATSPRQAAGSRAQLCLSCTVGSGKSQLGVTVVATCTTSIGGVGLAPPRATPSVKRPGVARPVCRVWQAHPAASSPQVRFRTRRGSARAT
jgi:IS605 OrfB family transposase